jgi:hypothetical protein
MDVMTKLTHFLNVGKKSQNEIERIISGEIQDYFQNEISPLENAAFNIVVSKTNGKLRKGSWPGSFSRSSPEQTIPEEFRMEEVHHPLRILALYNYCSMPLLEPYPQESHAENEWKHTTLSEFFPDTKFDASIPIRNLPQPGKILFGRISRKQLTATAILMHDLLGDGKKDEQYSNLYELETDLIQKLHSIGGYSEEEISDVVSATSYIIDGLDRKTVMDRILWLGNEIQKYFQRNNIESIDEFYKKPTFSLWGNDPKDKADYVYENDVLIANHISDLVRLLSLSEGVELPELDDLEKTNLLFNEESKNDNSNIKNLFSIEYIKRAQKTIPIQFEDIIEEGHTYHTGLRHAYSQDDDEAVRQLTHKKKVLCDRILVRKGLPLDSALEMRESYSMYSKHAKRVTHNYELDRIRLVVKYLDSIENLTTLSDMSEEKQATQVAKYTLGDAAGIVSWHNSVYVPEEMIDSRKYFHLAKLAVKSNPVGNQMMKRLNSAYIDQYHPLSRIWVKAQGKAPIFYEDSTEPWSILYPVALLKKSDDGNTKFESHRQNLLNGKEVFPIDEIQRVIYYSTAPIIANLDPLRKFNTTIPAEYFLTI